MLSNVCIDTEILDILTGSELKLFMIVNSYDEGLGAYVSPNRISEDHHIPLRTVYNSIESLQAKGYLSFTKEKIEGKTVKTWKWDFAKNGKSDENTDKQNDYQKDKKEIAKNGKVCSSSFSNKNTTTTYSAKNGKSENLMTVNTDKTYKDKKNANYGKSENQLLKDTKKLIQISEEVFRKSLKKYSMGEIKKAVVYVYRQKAKKPETYFLMTLKNNWALDINPNDFDMEVSRLENNRLKRTHFEEERKRKFEAKRVEEERQKIQLNIEREKIRMLEEKLMNGEKFGVQLEGYAKERFDAAIKKSDYKCAALYLLPYMQEEKTAVAV